jgi:hypothetical protein
MSLGLMISDKQAGAFVLELQWIDAFVALPPDRANRGS